MSGFVGILGRDGRPVDAAELDALIEGLAFRGPDGTRAWRSGSVGLGHARFVTNPARDGEPMPLSLDERWWITGHIRLDARDELIGALCRSEPPTEALGGRLREESRHASDGALVLRAYRAWGADCVQRLHGDFSFAIWDAREQRLFCARDRFGVRPFFYAEAPGAFVFGNTLACLRRHPSVGAQLDETALADYLVFGHLREPQLSFFAGIRRLPPAHTLVVTARDITVASYWSLPIEPELRYARAEDYVEQFTALLGRAVADRLPQGPVALRLSGGLDSGCIGGAVKDAAHAGAKGFCIGWNSAFADPEPGFARLTAEALGLPLAVYEEPDCVPLKDDVAEPEASYDIYRALTRCSLTPVAAHARVALDGQGGDEVFRREHVLDEWLAAPGLGVLADAFAAWRITGRRPPVGLRDRLRRRDHAFDPEWVNADWRRRVAPDQRAHQLNAANRRHAVRRARSRSGLASPLWAPYLESYDAALTLTPVEVRWPYLDERVVSFGLRVPPFPWTLEKYLQRQALDRHLPEAITRRPKSALSADPLQSFLSRNPVWVASQDWAQPWLAGRVDFRAWQRRWELGPRDIGETWALVRAIGLAHWLRLQ